MQHTKEVFQELKENEPRQPKQFDKPIQLSKEKPSRARILKIKKIEKLCNEEKRSYVVELHNLDTDQEEIVWLNAQFDTQTGNWVGDDLYTALISLEADENDEFMFTPKKIKGKFKTFVKYTVERLNN